MFDRVLGSGLRHSLDGINCCVGRYLYKARDATPLTSRLCRQADSLNGLGSVYEKKAMQAADKERAAFLDKAEGAFLESLELRLRVLSTQSPDVGQVATSLGSLYLNRRDHALARRYYEQAGAAYTASLGAQLGC